MAQKKAYEVESFVKKPVGAFNTILIYGPDRGLVSENATTLARNSGVDLNDAFSIVKLNSEDLKSQPETLADELFAIALFGGKKLIWVKIQGSEKSVITVVTSLLSSENTENILLIEAGDLKKSAPLRKLVEKGKSSIALPCFADEGKAIQMLIDQELQKANLAISLDARQMLVENLGGDRIASRSEIQKLALYCLKKDTVSIEDVQDIIGDAASITVDSIVDFVLSGNIKSLDLGLNRLFTTKIPGFLVLQGCLRQFQWLASIHSQAQSEGIRLTEVFNSNSRHIFFKRKPILERALNIWDMPSLAAICEHLQRTIYETRLRNTLDQDITRQALLAIAIKTAKRNSNR